MRKLIVKGSLIVTVISSPLLTMSVENPLGSIVGMGVGVTPEYVGSKETMSGAAPGGRIEYGDNVIEIYGTYAAINFSPNTDWEYGLATSFKLGREEFDDQAIGHVHDLGFGVDTGFFVAHQTLSMDSTIPYYVRRGVTVLSGESGVGDTKGTSIELHQNQWIPLSYTTFIGLGFGAVWSDSRHNTHYYGTSDENVASGWRQLYAWPVIVHRLTDDVYLGAGAYIQKVVGSASKSKLIADIGSEMNVTYGAGIGWSF